MIRLTDAQQRIVPLVAQGLLNKQIAHQLGIKEATVKCYVSAAIDRLGLANRVQLAVWYTRWEMEQEGPAKVVAGYDARRACRSPWGYGPVTAVALLIAIPAALYGATYLYGALVVWLVMGNR